MHFWQILTGINTVAIAYLFFRNFSTVRKVRSVRTFGHAKCATCGATVARYSLRGDGSVVCANCKP